MRLNIALAGALVAGIALPVMAQPVEYYIVQDTSTKHCTIVDKRPVGPPMTIVGPDGVVYHSRAEAETAMKTVKVCSD